MAAKSIVVGMVIVAFLLHLTNAGTSTSAAQVTTQTTKVTTSAPPSTSQSPTKQTTSKSSAASAVYSVSLLIGASLFAIKMRD